MEVIMNQFPNFIPNRLMNFWWSIPTGVQDFIKSTVPEKDTWTLKMTKDVSGVWVFSLPQFLTFNESMCNGTEYVMDYWFEQTIGYTPVIGSKMDVTVTKTEPTSDDFQTTIIWLYEDPYWSGSNIYLDLGSGLDVWLCPYVQVLFKGVPDKMWIKFEPIE